MAAVDMKTIADFELIFIGKVAAISGCDKSAHVSFAVQKLFRGKCFPETALEFDCTSDCQMNFSPNETWIIYASYMSYGKAKVEFCSYSRQQFENDKDDYNTVVHGMTFTEESAWLEKNLGLQKMDEKDVQSEQHHENIRPQGYAVLWYLGGGFLGLIVIYFLVQKFLK
jgi:hypothetical protein